LGCRPFFFSDWVVDHFFDLDGCNLRSKYLGILLSATALDENNGLFPVVFVAVESESSDTWFWFLQNLLQAFDDNFGNVCFISDQEKGLYDDMSTLLPDVEHRALVEKKFKTRYPGDFFERNVWDAAMSFSVPELNKAMNTLYNTSPQAWKEHHDLKYVGSRSQFKPLSRNHYITNNLSEPFNVWVIKGRDHPVVDLVDKIRVKKMEKRKQRRRLG